MTKEISNNKRIAKNTLMLYTRTLLLMFISLYTSRVVLGALGIEDFGIYNIVGGVVVLFTFINSALSTAVQRFLNFELGKKDFDAVQKFFSIGVTIHIAIALLILVLSETVGLWFLNNKLNIPESKQAIANVVYHLSIVTTCFNIIKIPYNATIIAYERMSFFAYVSILEGIMKLAIAAIISFTIDDKLIMYALMMMVVPIIMFTADFIYCRRKFTTCHYTLFWDRDKYKQVVSFSGWSLFGSLATMSAGQGINILLNIFYGVSINAAVGITNQVYAAVNSFVSNFQMAFRPQIVKSYSSKDYKYLDQLVNDTSKFSFILLFAISLPIFINIDYILSLWLTTVPEYTGTFVRLLLIYALFESLSGPLWMVIQATGQIRNYQIAVSLSFASIILISYVFLSKGYPPQTVYCVKASIAILNLLIRLFFVKKKLDFSLLKYFVNTILKTLLIAISTGVIIYLITFNLYEIKKLVASSILYSCLYPYVIYKMSLTKDQQIQIQTTIKKYIK